ncbi:hypothetical protein BZA77DRAFT_348666 [Pyronema omphalodes]|nr:hypothetical protein BZA77DRAFT_348666 [Pyronema omphalodes]
MAPRAPRTGRQRAVNTPLGGNTFGILQDSVTVEDAETTAAALIAALGEGYTPSPCTQCSHTTRAMVALSVAMKSMRGTIERFEMSASPRIDQMLQMNMAEWTSAIEERLSRVTMTLADHTDNLLPILNRLNNTVKETARKYEEQRRATRAETTQLKESISALTAQIIELKTAAPQIPPSPTIDVITSTVVEEMSLHLLDVQRDIQDVLDVVRDSAGKRKRACSESSDSIDASIMTPTVQGHSAQKPRSTWPVHTVMHSRHATTAAQEVLDALSGSSSSSPVIQQIIKASDSEPNSNTKPDTTPSNVGNAAPESTDKWRIVEGKRARRKKKATGSGPRQQTVQQNENPPKQQNGARGKKQHQPIMKHHSGNKTWADVVRSGGINVQIILGNDNLRPTTPVKVKEQRGERRGENSRRQRRGGSGGHGNRKVTGQMTSENTTGYEKGMVVDAGGGDQDMTGQGGD